MSRFHSSRWRPTRELLVLVVAALLFSVNPLNRVQAAAGDLDPTFGNGGKVTTDFFGVNDPANAMVVQSDGKIVLAGSYNSGANQGFAVARYRINGGLDTTFGGTGKVLTDFSGGGDGAFALALQADGKIVAAGAAVIGGNSHFGLARYNSNGSLDASFGLGGKVTTDFGFGADEVFALAIQPNNKIVAVGIVISNGIVDIALARYQENGDLDPTFGIDGKLSTDIDGRTDFAKEVAIQTDGGIVVAGSTGVPGLAPDFFILRYHADGSPDLSFGNEGRVITDFGEFSYDDGDGLAIQPDGRIVLVGSASSPLTLFDFAALRYNFDGSLDSSFGIGGKSTIDFSGQFDLATSVVLQADGKIVMAGYTSVAGASNDFAIARLNSDGSPDLGFGVDGKNSLDFFGLTDVATAVAIQPSGKIVVGGYAFKSIIDSDIDFALARYNGDGPIFDTCLEDDSSGNTLQFNSTTGDYLLKNCSGPILEGNGVVTIKGSIVTLRHNAPDRRVIVTVDNAAHKGSASLQVFSPRAKFTITDRNILNSSCSCF